MEKKNLQKEPRTEDLSKDKQVGTKPETREAPDVPPSRKIGGY